MYPNGQIEYYRILDLQNCVMVSVQVIKNVIQHEAGCQVKGFLFCYVGQCKRKKIVKG